MMSVIDKAMATKKLKSKKAATWTLMSGAKPKKMGALLIIILFACIGVAVLAQSFAYSNKFTYYSQKDPAWANKPYPYKLGTPDQSDLAISRSGCGPTSLAMVATALNRTVTPADIASWYGPRFHVSGGTDHSIYPVFAQDYGLQYAALGNFSDPGTRAGVQLHLSLPNSLVVIHAGPGKFTSTGHIMVFRAYEPQTKQFLIADPNNIDNNRWFTEAELLSKGNLNAAYSFRKVDGKSPTPTSSSDPKNP